MKFLKISLVALVTLLGVQTLTAQQGFGRAPQRGERGYSPPPRNITYEEAKPDATLRAQENATLYAEELGIDAFKKEVLKNYLKEYYVEKFDVIYSKTLPGSEKQTLLDAAKVKFEKQMKPVFLEENVDQILAFEDIGARKIKKAKKKRKKKNGKKDKG